jgi:hypothetical protein
VFPASSTTPRYDTATLRRALPLSADSRYASAVALLVADGGSVESAILLDREHFQRTRRNQGARTGCHTGQSGRRCGCRISRQWRKFWEVPNFCSGVQVIRVRHRPIDDIRFIFAEFFSIPQSVPQNAVSCTSYEVLGSLHVSVSCSKTEYTQIHTVEVIGSNPIAPTIFFKGLQATAKRAHSTNLPQFTGSSLRSGPPPEETRLSRTCLIAIA